MLAALVHIYLMFNVKKICAFICLFTNQIIYIKWLAISVMPPYPLWAVMRVCLEAHTLKCTDCCIKYGPSHHTEKYTMTLKSCLTDGCSKVLPLFLPAALFLSARSLTSQLSARTGQHVQTLCPPA